MGLVWTNDTSKGNVITSLAVAEIKTKLDDIYDALVAGAYGGRKYITFNYEGLCLDESVVIDGFYFSTNVIIAKVTIVARVAPTGANITIDLLKAGVEQTKIATLTAAATYEESIISAGNFLSTDRFGLKIKSVGSTEPGQSLIVIVHYDYTV